MDFALPELASDLFEERLQFTSNNNARIKTTNRTLEFLVERISTKGDPPNLPFHDASSFIIQNRLPLVNNIPAFDYPSAASRKLYLMKYKTVLG